jgi:uncharacterized phage protein (TIGR01671 family)
MREIKFRGKTVDNGEWVCGYYIQLDFYNSVDYVEESQIVLDNGHVYVVDLETVGQYTGLKDASGFEIYEGDILQGDGVFEVIFHDSAWWLFSVLDKTEQWSFAECNIPKCQIIGNIHETPELLEK